MSIELETALPVARRAYERGRLRTGALRAVAVATAVAALASVTLGWHALLWAVVPWATWTGVEWRGGALRAGGVRGVIAGAVTLVLPMTWLRPCCMPGMAMGEEGCCAQPFACWAAGAVVGVLAAVGMPRVAEGRRIEAALGVALAVGSVAAIRCAALLVGEAAGFAFGIVAGIAAASAASAWVAGRRAGA